MCHLCMGKLTSTHSQIALAQRAPITVEQRVWVWQWFLTTKYFAFHRRMSRGRAKRLIDIMSIAFEEGSSELNPANVAIRGPHDLVTDAASLKTHHDRGFDASPYGEVR